MEPAAEREAVLEVLNEMREHGVGITLFYAQKLAEALGEPPVITLETMGRLAM